MGEETYPTSRNGLDWRWLVFLAYVTAWTVALLVPIPENSVGGSVFSLDLKFLLSKSLHVGAYAFLIVLITQLRIGLRSRWLLVLFASLHGMATEYLQTFTETRTGCWQDVGIDHLGIALGLLVTWKWWRS
jgi:VanZ family protein